MHVKYACTGGSSRGCRHSRRGVVTQESRNQASANSCHMGGPWDHNLVPTHPASSCPVIRQNVQFLCCGQIHGCADVHPSFNNRISLLQLHHHVTTKDPQDDTQVRCRDNPTCWYGCALKHFLPGVSESHAPCPGHATLSCKPCQ